MVSQAEGESPVMFAMCLAIILGVDAIALLFALVCTAVTLARAHSRST